VLIFLLFVNKKRTFAGPQRQYSAIFHSPQPIAQFSKLFPGQILQERDWWLREGWDGWLRKGMGGLVSSTPAWHGKLSGYESRHPSKIKKSTINGRHKQRTGQHILARQKNSNKKCTLEYKIFPDDIASQSILLHCR
jgi:hypothetical protein